MPARAIAVLTTSYPLYPGSPSGIFVARLLEHLPESIETSVITPSTRKIIPSVLPGGNIRVYPFRYAPRRYEVLAHEPGGIPVALRGHAAVKLLLPGFLLSMAICFWRHARGADVLHANWAICGLVAGIIGRLRRLPVVTTLRGEDVTRSQTSIIDRWILITALRLSTQVVTVSSAFSDLLSENYPRWANKIIIIPNGVDNRFIDVGARRQISGKRKKLKLISVGSLIPRKGIDQILEALSQSRYCEQIRLKLVGDGPERMSLEALADKYSLRDMVHFSGEVSESEIPDLLAEADVMLLASHSEGRPNSVLEAMASGLAVIATDIPGVNEIIHHQETGLLFRDGDPVQLAGYIDTLIKDPNLIRYLGENAFQYIQDNDLVWGMTASAYVDAYNQIAEG